MNEILFTVFTPTYNRANTLYRVYDSLCNQTYKNFEWIIVDDGSTDTTKELIQSYIAENKIKIIYFYQKNSGKHVAVNRGVKLAKGELFVIADSDDSFIPESLEVFYNNWIMLKDKQTSYKGITCRCIDEVGNKIGNKSIPKPYYDVDELSFRYKFGYKGELWGAIRTDILKEYPFPECDGLKFYPECIVWDSIAKKYVTRYIDDTLRINYHDQNNATTSKITHRYKENYYLWQHYVNDLWDDYFKYDRKTFLKAIVGINRDGLLCGKKYKMIIKEIDGVNQKILAILFLPIAIFLAKKLDN